MAGSQEVGKSNMGRVRGNDIAASAIVKRSSCPNCGAVATPLRCGGWRHWRPRTGGAYNKKRCHRGEVAVQCPTCGTNNATSALRCKQCGAPLADAEPGFREGSLATAGADAVLPRRLTRRERREQRKRDGEPGWINGALVLGTAIFAAIALIGIWWNLRAPYVDPTPKSADAITVAPFNNGSNAPPLNASGDANAAAPGTASDAESAALARAQTLAAVDAAASGAAADVASASAAPLTASAATAALTAAATSAMSPPSSPAPDDMMTLLSRRDAANAARPVPNPDLPAHLDNSDIGQIAAADAARAPVAASSPSTASVPGAANTIAAALAQCDKYRWFEVIPKQRCIWAVCNGRWGRDGCPAGVNPGESH